MRALPLVSFFGRGIKSLTKNLWPTALCPSRCSLLAWFNLRPLLLALFSDVCIHSRSWLQVVLITKSRELMATGQVGEVVGRHLTTINIMDDTLLQDFTLPEHKSAMDRIVFLPYIFKELKEVELVEFSAMCAFGITPYITVLQRNLVPRDLFYWGLFSCDASDERLIITGLNGSATVVGWQELERAFGAKHSEDDEFRATKIMQK
ncbi:hypothetical protein R1sor_009032 [Riccia sorocarpa]|uniref:Uncharacterized protein n=1 Tax=Riccia sorocarpa TaxID=122646 RepID=A0ABD3H4V1_9MARC